MGCTNGGPIAVPVPRAPWQTMQFASKSFSPSRAAAERSFADVPGAVSTGSATTISSFAVPQLAARIAQATPLPKSSRPGRTIFQLGIPIVTSFTTDGSRLQPVWLGRATRARSFCSDAGYSPFQSASRTLPGVMGRLVIRLPVAPAIALAIAGNGGTIGTSPTPRTP